MESKISFFSAAKDVAFVLAIYLYFSGWIYLYYYYYFFGLSIRQLDIEFYYFFIYSVNIFLFLADHKWSVLLPIFAGAVIYYLSIRYYCKRFKKPNPNYFTMILLLPFIYFIARNAAEYNADREWKNPDLPTVVIGFKDDFLRDNATDNKASAISQFQTIELLEKQNLLNKNIARQLRLLSSNTEEYWLLLPRGAGSGDGAQVIEVYKENIKYIHIFN